MVFWIKKHIKYIWIITITLFVSIPLFTNNLYLGHDTLFHLSRIEGLANSIIHKELIPTIYPLKNAYYGYASALFYCDILLYPFALLYLLNIDIVICYKLCIIFYTFIAAITSYNLIFKISNNKFSASLACLLYLTTTYRLSNIYVRGAIGEIISYAFLPIILLGIYKLFYSNEDSKIEIILGFSLLILSHNISFVLACILFLFFIIFNIPKLKYTIKDITISVIIVIALTSFFTFPMIEQLFDQNFYLENNTSIFFTSDLNIYQLFINKLNFNISGKTEDSLTVNPGIWLLLLSLCNLFYKPDRFIKHCLLFASIFLFITLGIIPLSYLNFLCVIQFIWRFMMLVCVLLLAPACVNIFNIFCNNLITFCTICLFITGNTLYLIYPYFLETNTISNNIAYSELIDGSIIDPYYSAFYVRVEVAGADYLPTDGIDYKNFKYGLYDENYNYIGNPIMQNYEITFDINKPNQTIIIPKTYYKGYCVYNIQKQKLIKLPTYQDKNTKLLAFKTLNTSGNYIVKYNHTLVQILSYFITITSIIILFLLKKKDKCE